MVKKKYINMGIASVFSLGFVGHFICLPAFADNPVKISIVEVSSDRAGGFEMWEDITSAMPGVTYSTIPRVKNDGSVPVSVKMCLSESATTSSGETIMLPANTFAIEVNEHWVLDSEGSTNPSDPASGNCYNYSSKIEVGAVTEPLFSEVTLSSDLGNEYENSTFNLHLNAEAIGDYASAPNKPDTGVNTASYFDIVSPVVFSASGIVLFAIFAFILRRLHKRSS